MCLAERRGVALFQVYKGETVHQLVDCVGNCVRHARFVSSFACVNPMKNSHNGPFTRKKKWLVFVCRDPGWCTEARSVRVTLRDS
jgi:hypothetical protein